MRRALRRFLRWAEQRDARVREWCAHAHSPYLIVTQFHRIGDECCSAHECESLV